jgi:hypothetical protein
MGACAVIVRGCAAFVDSGKAFIYGPRLNHFDC